MDKKEENIHSIKNSLLHWVFPSTLFIIYVHDFMLGLPYELKVLQNWNSEHFVPYSRTNSNAFLLDMI